MAKFNLFFSSSLLWLRNMRMLLPWPWWWYNLMKNTQCDGSQRKSQRTHELWYLQEIMKGMNHDRIMIGMAGKSEDSQIMIITRNHDGYDRCRRKDRGMTEHDCYRQSWKIWIMIGLGGKTENSQIMIGKCTFPALSANPSSIESTAR